MARTAPGDTTIGDLHALSRRGTGVGSRRTLRRIGRGELSPTWFRYLFALLAVAPCAPVSESVLRRSEKVEGVVLYFPNRWHPAPIGESDDIEMLRSHPAIRVEIFDLQLIGDVVGSLDVSKDCPDLDNAWVSGIVEVLAQGAKSEFRIIGNVLLDGAGECHPMPKWIRVLAEMQER